jgi:hypothetical protein
MQLITQSWQRSCRHVINGVLAAMQMPYRLLYSAWHIFGCLECAYKHWTFDAPEEIRTSDPQIRSFEAAALKPAYIAKW